MITICVRVRKSYAAGPVVKTGHCDAVKELECEFRSGTRDRRGRVLRLRSLSVCRCQHGLRETHRRRRLYSDRRVYVLHM